MAELTETISQWGPTWFLILGVIAFESWIIMQLAKHIIRRDVEQAVRLEKMIEGLRAVQAALKELRP